MSARPPVRTAIIAAAGFGTRMWPATKVVPKELFPVGRVPALVHLAWELVDAGIEDLVIVVNRDNHRLIEELFDPAQGPEAKIAHEADVVRFTDMIERLDVRFVVQSGPYGNGVPLLNAVDVIGERHCIYAFGDDIVLGENTSDALVDIYQQTGCPVLAAQPVPEERARAFGIIETCPEGALDRVTRLVEKPEPGETDSTLAAFGRYLVTPELIELLREVKRGKGGEYWFVDAVVARLAQGGGVYSYALGSGRWITVGDTVGYAAAVDLAVNGPA